MVCRPTSRRCFWSIFEGGGGLFHTVCTEHVFLISMTIVNFQVELHLQLKRYFDDIHTSEVIGLLSDIKTDIEVQIKELETQEKNDQEKYEHFMQDAKDSEENNANVLLKLDTMKAKAEEKMQEVVASRRTRA